MSSSPDLYSIIYPNFELGLSCTRWCIVYCLDYPCRNAEWFQKISLCMCASIVVNKFDTFSWIN